MSRTTSSSHAVRPETLDKYLFFSKGNYTRNLIFKNDLFECMTICWEVGQHSRIHNHRDQNCWMSAPIGRLKVQNFRVDEKDATCGTCKIVPTEIYEMDAAHPVHVNPLEPVHQVLNLPEFNQRAVSIHVYSKPFDSCEVYSAKKAPTATSPSTTPANTASSTPTKSSCSDRPLACALFRVHSATRAVLAHACWLCAFPLRLCHN